MNGRCALAVATLLFAFAGCAGGEPAKGPDPHTEYHPPWPPGSSIAQSKVCDCTTCTPASCCGGSNDVASQGEGGDTAGLSVMSCTPRCTRLVWRVPNAAECDSRRPEACCAGAT